MENKILIIVPAYNEAENIVKTIDDIVTNTQSDYIIIDDCSKDDTYKICKEKNFNIIHLPVNYGLTSGVQIGMKYAYENKNKPADKLPIFIIGGNISDMNVYNRLLKMRQDMMHVNKNLAQRFIIVKGFLNTHLVATGADLFLVPSVFEPCGLTQIEAMAKGALPIASSTGGLVNTIKDGVDGFRTTQFFDQEGDDVKAQIYYEKGTPRYASNADAFHAAFVRALDKYYNDRVGFRKMQQAAMSNDFSWDKEDGSFDKYVRLKKPGKI